MTEFHTIFFIACIAALAPLLMRIPVFARVPIVAIELVLGMLVGPHGAGLVIGDGAIDFLGEFGLVYLFFQAGFEFNQKEISGEPLRLGAMSWLASFAAAIAISMLLFLAGIVEAPLLVALILPTTAFGVLIPMLRQSGDTNTDFGRYLLGVAAVGELAPLVLASVVLAQRNHHLHQTVLSVSFILIGLAAIFFLTAARSERLAASIVKWLGDSELLPIRIALVVLLGFVSFADKLGMELVVGAYMAGMAVAILVRDTRAEILEDRLTAIGSGFLVPLFFIKSGAEFDFTAIVASPASFFGFLLFCAAFLLIRIAPLNIYKATLPERDLPALALLSSGTLPLVVAISHLGVTRGSIAPATASALVGAAMMTVTVFPTLALWLRADQPSRLQGAVAAGLLTIADRSSATASHLFAKLPESWRAQAARLAQRFDDLFMRSAK